MQMKMSVRTVNDHQYDTKARLLMSDRRSYHTDSNRKIEEKIIGKMGHKILIQEKYEILDRIFQLLLIPREWKLYVALDATTAVTPITSISSGPLTNRKQ